MKWGSLWRDCQMTCQRIVIRLCYMRIWTFLFSSFILKRWKRQGLRETIQIRRGQGLFKVVRQSLCLKFKIILISRRGFPTKFLSSSLRLVVIGCIILSLKREGVVLHQQRRELVEGVEKSIMVIAKREGIISLVVVKVGTMFETSKILRGKRRVVASSRKWL